MVANDQLSIPRASGHLGDVSPCTCCRNQNPLLDPKMWATGPQYETTPDFIIPPNVSRTRDGDMVLPEGVENQSFPCTVQQQMEVNSWQPEASSNHILFQTGTPETPLYLDGSVAQHLSQLSNDFSGQPRDWENNGLYGAVLHELESTNESEYPDTVATLIDMGVSYAKFGHYTWALSVLTRSLTLSVRLWGTDHIVTGYAKLNVGQVLSAMGRFKEAIDVFQEAVDISAKALGYDDPRVAQIQGLMADAYFKLSQFDVSIQLCSDAIEVSTRSGSTISLRILETLARAYTGRGNFDKAQEIYKNIIEAKSTTVSANHLEIADTTHNMGITLQGLHKLDEAIEAFETALTIYRV